MALWRRRFIEGGTKALLQDASRSGRTPSVTPEVESRIVETTFNDKPPAATHWSTRTLAAELGVSAASVSRHWRKHGLKPHLERSFKVSRDPQFANKLEDIVGLHLRRPSTPWCCAATR